MARIIHVISHLEEGGAQRQLSYILSQSIRHQCEVVSLIASPENKLFPYFRNATTPIHFLSHSNDFYAPEVLPSLRRLLGERADVVHCWLYESIIQGVLTSRRLKIPCIASPRSMLESLRIGKNKGWERWLARKTIQRADLTVFPSNSAATDFLDNGWVEAGRVRVLRNVVDCDYYTPCEPGDAIVAIGRISADKNYPELARIMNSLRQQDPNLRCIAAGSGDPGTLKGIDFVGSVSDVREILKKALLYISTSHTEGMSNALLEAQAMGIPAIVRDAGANSEVIEEGWNGCLARTPEEFVEKSLILLRDSELRKRMSDNARMKMTEQFSLAQMGSKVESVYDELL